MDLSVNQGKCAYSIRSTVDLFIFFSLSLWRRFWSLKNVHCCWITLWKSTGVPIFFFFLERDCFKWMRRPLSCSFRFSSLTVRKALIPHDRYILLDATVTVVPLLRGRSDALFRWKCMAAFTMSAQRSLSQSRCFFFFFFRTTSSNITYRELQHPKNASWRKRHALGSGEEKNGEPETPPATSYRHHTKKHRMCSIVGSI